MERRIIKSLLFSAVLLVSAFIFNYSSSSPKITQSFKSISPTAALSTVTLVSGNEGARANQTDQTYKVVRVVDGDTFDVEISGKTERLRMIGIDTPETVDPRKPVQCFGAKASDEAKKILTDNFVSLEPDPTQGDKDKYGRLLRYTFLPDGTNFGLFMISEGFANEYTYKLPYKYQAQFKQAEIDARQNNKGLWSPSTCSGNK